MNKNRHRIIFNAARGQRMVVAESASNGAAGGTSGRRTASNSAEVPLHGVALHPLTAGLALALVLGLAFHTSAHAQIVADPGAPGNQRPTVLQTGNGLPQINIQTPSAAGVSRNIYSQFDVQSGGAILNNSRNNTGTQLGGHIAGNPWLATGEARVILNEVRSSNPSHLNGYTEIAGRRAEVVIANPAGIQVNGGGFINSAGVTLTTGTPVMNNGQLESFRVGGGKVIIEGLGLDTSTADHTAILARAMEVNAGLWAKDLTVVTGTNEVKDAASGAAAQVTRITSTDTGPVPNFMLDVAAIGGMYAGKIHLVGTEAGLGVNNRGSLVAQEGEWVLKTDGSLVNTGKIQARGDLSVQARDAIDNAGPNALISSQGSASLSTSGQVSNTGQARLLASGTLSVGATGPLNNTDGIMGTDGTVRVTANGIDNTRGTIASTQSSLDLDSGTQAITNIQGKLVAQQNATLAGATLNNNEGSIQAAGTIGIATTGELTNVSGRIQALGNVGIDTQGGGLDNTGGRVTSQAALTLSTGALHNDTSSSQAGLIGSNGPLAIHAATISNGADAGGAQSNIWSGQTASITATSFANAGVLSGGNVTLDTAVDVTNTASASIEASGNLSINTAAHLINAGQLIANNVLNVHAKDIDNTGTLEASDQALNATGTFNNAAGASIAASNSIDMGATTFNNRGLVNANEASGASQVHIHASTVNNIGTGAIFGDRIAIAAAAALNNRPETTGGSSPVIAAREQLDIGAQALNNEDGALLYSGGSMAVGGALDATLAAAGQAMTVSNQSADIEVTDDLRISAMTLNNERRNAAVNQVQVVDETATLNMPGWWVNGTNQHGKAIEATSNHIAKQYYLLDPASIVSETPLVTPDGNVIYKVEVALSPNDSVYYAAGGAYGGQYGVRERVGVGAGTVVLYATRRQTGVTNPDQVAGTPDVFTSDIHEVIYWQRNSLNYSDAYGHCTTNCTMFVVEPGYSDPQSTMLRSTQRNLTGGHGGYEVSRTAHHTVIEDELSANAGASASIRSGGHMRLDIGSSLTNRYADIQAGGVLNLQATDATVTNVGQTLKRTHSFQNTSETASGGSFDWTNPDISEVIGQAGGTLSGTQQLNIVAKNLTNSDLSRSTGLPTSGLGFLGVSLPSANAPISVPNNPLFQSSTPGSNYLIQGAPAFTGYRTWLGSDYLIANLGSDPNLVQKRLGDGIYEQKLVREQVAQLTGRRFLDGHANDESQYQALMDSGVAYAKQWNLIPGVALSAEQMALLTSDLVWLVERDVVLRDGTRTKALVPEVYVRQVPEGDFRASGALLAGNTMNLQIQEDLVNAGGRIEGSMVVADVGRDLSNIGGLMQARSELLASAGRHVTISSPTHTTSFTGEYVHQSRTELAGIGEMKVGSSSGARLSIEAGGNVTLQGASVSNASTSGSTTIQADGDVRLETVTVSSTDNTEYNAKNYQRHSQSQEVGSQVVTHGTTAISAGNDINIRQGTVDAGAGLLSVQGGNDINITAGQSTLTVDEAVEIKRSGLLTKKTTTTLNTLDETTHQGSTLNGGVVAITTSNNLTLEGSSINGTDGVLVHAGNMLSAYEARDSRSESDTVSVKKSGFAGSFAGVPLPIGAGSRDAATSTSNTAMASSITSENGGVLLQGDGAVLLQGVKVDAAKDIKIQGGIVSIAAATDYTSSSSEHYTRGTNIGLTGWHDPGKGIDAKSTDKNEQQTSLLDRTVLNGANVSIAATGADGNGGLLSLAGTTVNTPGTLTLSAEQLILGTQTTQTDISQTSQGTDWTWQEAKGQGSSDQTTNYNQFNVGTLAMPVQSVQIGLGARDSILALAQQPGMGWIEQIHNDPALAGKVDWDKVEEAHKNWHYSQQGLTPEAAAVVTLVVAYFTAGAASGAGATAGNAAAVSAGEGVALAGGGTFVTATGATISSVVGGAVTAGISALAGQAAVALINNKGDIGGALDDLGSSANVKSLLTAIVTGGVLGGLNLNPTGAPTSGAGAQGYMVQLGQNLQAAAAKAVIGTAINGGSLEDSLANQLKTAFIDTFAAQGAHQIGDWTQTSSLDGFTNKIAHAIAGCAIGAAKAESSSGCGAGALGAAIGELSAELYGMQIDTVEFASMMAGIAAAIAGGDAAAINLASQTGANAAANNYLKHAERVQLKKATQACYTSGDAAACRTKAALEYKDEMSDRLLANAAASCEGAECNEVANHIKQQMAGLGCPTANVCPDYSTLSEYWKVAQAKAQGLEGVYPESWLLDAKLILDLGKLGIKLASGAVSATRGSLDALGQLAKVDAKEIANINNKLYTDWPVAQDLIGYRITELADRATRNPDAPLVVLGKYVAGSSNSYEQVARAKGATFFELPGNSWDNAVQQLGAERMWSINKEFLDSQIAKGKVFEFTIDPRQVDTLSFTAAEFRHLQSNGYRLVESNGKFYATKQ